MTKCKANDCVKDAVYNIKGQKQVKFCFIHKLPDMVDVFRKMCEYENCYVQARFNFSGNKKGIFCSNHRIAENQSL